LDAAILTVNLAPVVVPPISISNVVSLAPSNIEHKPSRTEKPMNDSEQKSNLIGSFLSSQNMHDLKRLVLKFVLQPKTYIQCILRSVNHPASVFEQTAKGGEAALEPVAFWIVTCGLGFVFKVLAALLAGVPFSGFISAVVSLLTWVLGWVVLILFFWILLRYVLRREIAVSAPIELVSGLSWTFLIGVFPLWAWFPALVSGIMSAVGIGAFAFLSVRALRERFSLGMVPGLWAVWGISGLFALFVIGGSFAGSGAGSRADRQIQAALDEANQRVLEASQHAESAAQIANERVAEAQASRAEMSEPETPEIDPKKQLNQLLKTFKAMGVAEVTAKQKDLLRSLDGHLQGADFSNLKVVGLDLRGLDLREAVFDGSEMKGWWFQPYGSGQGAQLQGASFRKAVLDDVDMSQTNLENADFTGAQIVGTGYLQTAVDFEDAILRGANLSKIKLVGDQSARSAYMHGVDAEGALFKEAHLPQLDANGGNFRSADFTKANLKSVSFNQADIRDAIFVEADLTGIEISKQLELNVKLVPGVSPFAFTSGANFQGAKLTATSLDGRRFRFCNFRSANLVNANMQGGNFVGSDFSGANLTGANLERSNLAHTTFKNANLKNAKMKGAHTAAVEFEGSGVEKTESQPNLSFSTKQGKAPDMKASELGLKAQRGEITTFAGENLRGKSFAGLRLHGIDFSGTDLRGADFSFSELGDCVFDLADLENTDFTFARIYGCSFDEAKLDGSTFRGAAFHENTFLSASLVKADFSHTGRGAFGMGRTLDFSGADLTGAVFFQSRLSKDDATAEPGPSSHLKMNRAKLIAADVREAWWQNVSLIDADLSEIKGEEIDMAGFYANWNTRWQGASFRKAIASRSTLTNAESIQQKGRTDFAQADWRGANLAEFNVAIGTLLNGIDFSGCVFSWAPWQEKNPDNAGTRFSLVNLSGANFSGADLRGADFRNTDLVGADMSNADLRNTYWAINESLSAGALEGNLGPLWGRYQSIDFSNAKFADCEVVNGNFSGSVFTGATFGEGTKINFQPPSVAHMPEKNYVRGFPARAR
jgi:uncharacterized protein YjbI with pentapeptide repeats